jgi:hypothetical protein
VTGRPFVELGKMGFTTKPFRVAAMTAIALPLLSGQITPGPIKDHIDVLKPWSAEVSISYVHSPEVSSNYHCRGTPK